MVTVDILLALYGSLPLDIQKKFYAFPYICRSQPSPQDPRSFESYRRGSARIPSQPEEGEKPSTPATVLVQAAIEVWEKKDASALARYLSDDLVCRHVLPQPVGKAQLIAFMQAITTAFPDWSFNGHFSPGSTVPLLGESASLFFYGFIDAFFHALCLSYRQSTEKLL